MKKINFKNSVLALAAVLSLASCSDEYLEVKPTGTYLEENFYQNETQAYQGLIGTYDIMRKQSGGFENMIAMLNAGSDDFYAGGGSSTDGAGIQGFSNYTINPTTIPGSFWSDYYQGIFRANTMLVKLPDVPMDEAKKSRFAAEVKALRAYYYFQLVTMFGEIPFYTTNLTADQFYTIEKSSPAVVYAQIELDLNEAIAGLPATVDAASEAGRFNKGAAQALLGKVLLYQGKNAEAAAQLAQVNGTPGQPNQYGNQLLANFADLWNIDNKFNSESILETSHTKESNATWGNWGSGSDEGNSLNVMVGPRGYVASGAAAPLYQTGWSFNPATLDLAAALENDPRRDATLANVGALKLAGLADYSPGYQDTGYFLKKFMPTNADITDGGGDQVLNYRQNTYVIRLADTYLLEAEALGGTGARAQALLDAVRARVGLPSVPVSLQAIWNERRLELAGEGHRWNDLVRTGRAATVLASRGFIAGKHEHWPIPIKETENTKITQNPAYN
ncbi:RagB/SusD family nutrient uptake outer membrane protein [Flavobacterium zepuense]|uniref:RagB/SusD family nutrient uptake outer membrane protein n=1 Tax=Flavobacterium zepuense TaxID=2593302 RepID=A0A552V7K0_9FLAO|nr:RagB/SusD family nutrient uptake outer membrane protein [Flavobacterium zepuense]TRW26439.1 RagB/SusD family nutrient uptake outer membrane protein [Flavobacterium zepuense]